MLTGEYMTNIDQIPIIQVNGLSQAERTEIDHELTLLETRQAASIEALKIVQRYRKWVSDESLIAVADYLQVPVADLEGVATFYNLIYRRPVGQHVIHVCNSVACHLCGYESVLNTIKQHLDIDYGETTHDGMFTLLSNACLGGCDKAPVIMIGTEHYGNLTPASVINILDQVREGMQSEQERSSQ